MGVGGARGASTLNNIGMGERGASRMLLHSWAFFMQTPESAKISLHVFLRDFLFAALFVASVGELPNATWHGACRPPVQQLALRMLRATAACGAAFIGCRAIAHVERCM